MIKMHKKLGQKLLKTKSKSKSQPKIKTKVIDGNKAIKINTNKDKNQKTKIKDLANTISSKRQTISRKQSRPKSSISNTFKKQKEIQYNINMHDLVTQEDIILISEQTELELLPTVNIFKPKKLSIELQQEHAATLIQKTWRGYKTILLIKHYLNLYKKDSKHNNELLTKKRQKQNQYNQTSKQTIRSKYQINMNINMNISPINQYVYQTEQQISVAKIDKDQLCQISSFNLPSQSLIIQQTNISVLDPILRVTQFQLKLVLQRQQHQLMNLETDLNKKKISNKLYNLKKNNIAIYFNEQKRKLQLSRSQLSLGFLKVPLSSIYPQISKLKKKSCYSEQKILLKKIIQSDTDDEIMSLNMQFTYNNFQDPIIHQSDINDIYPVNDIDYINTSDIENNSSESIEVQNIRQNVDYIENSIQNILIQQFTMQLYLSQKIGQVFSPFFDINSIYKFKKITKTDIQQFINLMLTQFRPSNEDLLKRLNQKINPSAYQLLKILRNAEDDIDDEFYELVLPEPIFKNYRQWKDNQNKQHIQIDQPEWEMHNNLEHEIKLLFKIKQQQFKQKRIKMQKFQKDLQAMYFKAIFNCLNQSIIQVKCSYSTISGRSTIGPGQLQVSLLDSNSFVSTRQISQILKKSKDSVLDNFKYCCPSLDTSSFQSVYKFQQVLMKQLSCQIDLNQHRWLSFFDQHLQIAMQVNNLIVQQLLLQATKEIYWKLLNR